MPRISICLPVYNGAAFVEDALASIVAQTCTDYIVIAGDNASTDDTSDILRSWSSRIPMEIVSQSETLPMQSHFNALIDRIDTDAYMLLCHDDYLYAPHALEAALAVIDTHPHISAVYSDIAYVSEGGHLLARRVFHRSGEQNAERLGRDTLRTARNMFGIPILVRSAALDAARYDPDFRYIADVDLSWRISQDAPLWHISEVLLANRYSGRNNTWSLLADAHAEFVRLAGKRGLNLSRRDLWRMKVKNWQVGGAKQMFGLYERLMTRIR